MILSLQTNSFGSCGGIPTYNRLVCRALNNFDFTLSKCVLIAMDRKNDIAQSVSLHPNLQLSAFGGSRIHFVKSAILTVVLKKVRLLLAGHVNYAPLCLLLKRLRPQMRFGILIYGSEAWERLPLLRRWSLQQADFIISISEHTKQEAIKVNRLEGKRVFVLPNSIEWDRTKILSSENTYLLPKGTRLLSVGRLDAREKRKGFDTVIRSLPFLAEKIPDVHYIIIGSGTDLKRHKELAKRLGVSERVHFLGTVEEQVLHQCYRSCDVFVMPSSQEGFGFVYLEAMLYGKPVVAANSAGAPEVVQDGITGILVEYDNRDQLTEALLDLCLDLNKRRRFGTAGYERLQQNFTFAHFQTKLTEIIRHELPALTSAQADQTQVSATPKPS